MEITTGILQKLSPMFIDSSGWRGAAAGRRHGRFCTRREALVCCITVGGLSYSGSIKSLLIQKNLTKELEYFYLTLQEDISMILQKVSIQIPFQLDHPTEDVC